MSKILDRELARRKPVKGPHGEVVGATVVDGKLLSKVVERKEGMAEIKAFLVFTVAAFHLAVVARCMSLCRIPDLAAAASNRVGSSCLLLEKRLVNSKPLSVRKHST